MYVVVSSLRNRIRTIHNSIAVADGCRCLVVSLVVAAVGVLNVTVVVIVVVVVAAVAANVGAHPCLAGCFRDRPRLVGH